MAQGGNRQCSVKPVGAQMEVDDMEAVAWDLR